MNKTDVLGAQELPCVGQVAFCSLLIFWCSYVLMIIFGYATIQEVAGGDVMMLIFSLFHSSFLEAAAVCLTVHEAMVYQLQVIVDM